MSKFVLIVPNSNAEQQVMITRHFAQRASWWHYAPDVWLLRFRMDVAPVQLRDEVKQIVPGANIMALKFVNNLDDWAGYGPSEWGDWFAKAWDSATPP